MDDGNAMEWAELEDDELFALGLRLSARGDAGSAIAYFKRLIGRSPRHARGHWALATEYAESSMTERAATHFAQAVELAPEQFVARFQFGLLRLTEGNVEAAEQIWQPLDVLDPAHPVRRFKQGLLLMVRDRFDEALEVLRLAATDPTVDIALRRDIEATIQRIEAGRNAGPDQPPTDPAAASTAAAPDVSLESHLAFSVYSGSGGRH